MIKRKLLPIIVSAVMAASPIAYSAPVFADDADTVTENAEVTCESEDLEEPLLEAEELTIEPFVYEGDSLAFIDADGAAFGMFTPQDGSTCYLSGDTVKIYSIPKNVTVYSGFYLNADISQNDTWLEENFIAYDADAHYTFSLSSEMCGKAYPIAPKKNSDGGTTSKQYYLAIPAADKLEAEPIDATAISLSQTSASLITGDTLELTATLEPEGANSAVAWVSSDDNVATVDENGVVTAVAEGNAVITVSSAEASAECAVSVFDLEVTELTASSTTGMFKAVSGSIVKNPITGSTVLRFALSGTGYQNIFIGTYEEAAATTASEPIDTSNWIGYYLNEAGKYEFEVPITEGQTYIPVAAISHSYYTQGIYKWYPRQLEIDYDAKTLVSGDYDFTAPVTVTSYSPGVKPQSAALETIGGPNSNNYAEILKVTMPDASYTRAFIGTADEAAAADSFIELSEANVFEFGMRANATGGTLKYDYLEADTAVSFFNAETESWEETVFTASKSAMTLEIKPANELLILEQPVNAANASVGDTVEFSLTAYNADSYQWFYSKDEGATWYKSKADGSDTDTLSLLLTSSNKNNQYRCEVKGLGDTLTSNTVKATFAAITIQNQPGNTSMTIGQTSSISIRLRRSSTDGTPLKDIIPKIQWYYSKDGGNKWYKSSAPVRDNGSTSSYIYYYLDVTPANAAALDTIFRCEVTCPDGTKLISNSAGCSNKVAISAQPTASLANEKVAVLKVSASYAASYKWQYSKDGGEKWYSSTAEGADSNTLFFTYKEAAADNLYRVKVTGTSGAVITSDSVRLGDCVNNPIADAVITKQPSGMTVGKTAVISLTATNATAYQWYYSKDDGNKWYVSKGEGADTNTLNVTVKASAMNSIYRCKVAGKYGTDIFSDTIALSDVAANVVDDAYIADLMSKANFGKANCMGTTNCFGSMAFKPLVDDHNYYSGTTNIVNYLKGVFAEDENGNVYLPTSALSRISYTAPLTTLNFGLAYSAYKEYVDRNGLEMPAEVAESARLALKYFNTADYTKEGYNNFSGSGLTFLSEAVAVVALGGLLGQADTERFATLAKAAYENMDSAFWNSGMYLTPFLQLCARYDWFDKSALPAIDPSVAFTAANVQNYYAWGIDVANDYPALWSAFVASAVQDGSLSAAEAKAFTYYYAYRETNGAAHLGVYGSTSKVVDFSQYLND